MDLQGLRWKASVMRFRVSSLGPGRPDRRAVHRQPSSLNFAYHFMILLKTGAALWNSARNHRCTVTTDEVLAYSKTQNDFTFTERHICYYRLLAANQGNYVRGLFLKKTW